ncbi:MAG: hypothetical protein WBS20_03435 [Lysobacterales bacterium]
MPIFVNQTEIKDTEIGREMQYHPAGSQEEAWYQAAQSLVIRQVLLQQAAEAGLCEDPGSINSGEKEEELIDKLLQRDVHVPEADEATCRRYYDNHPDSFVDSRTGQAVTFTRAHANIRDYLHTKAMRIAVAEYIKALAYKARIKGFELVSH